MMFVVGALCVLFLLCPLESFFSALEFCCLCLWRGQPKGEKKGRIEKGRRDIQGGKSTFTVEQQHRDLLAMRALDCVAFFCLSSQSFSLLASLHFFFSYQAERFPSHWSANKNSCCALVFSLGHTWVSGVCAWRKKAPTTPTNPGFFSFFFGGEKRLSNAAVSFWAQAARCRFYMRNNARPKHTHTNKKRTKRKAFKRHTLRQIAHRLGDDCDDATTYGVRAHTQAGRATLATRTSLLETVCGKQRARAHTRESSSNKHMATHGKGLHSSLCVGDHIGVLVHGRFVCVRCAGPLLAVGFWPCSVRFVGRAQNNDGGGDGGAQCAVCGIQRQMAENTRCDSMCAAPSDDIGPTASDLPARAPPPQEEAPPSRRFVCLLM